MTGEACVGTLGLTPELRLHCYASCSSNTMIIFTQSRFNPPVFLLFFFIPAAVRVTGSLAGLFSGATSPPFHHLHLNAPQPDREEHGMNTK